MGLISLTGGGSDRTGLSSLTGGSGRAGLSSLTGGSGRAAAAGGFVGGSSIRLFLISRSTGTPHLLRGAAGVPAAFPAGGVGGDTRRAADGAGEDFTGADSG